MDELENKNSQASGQAPESPEQVSQASGQAPQAPEKPPVSGQAPDAGASDATEPETALPPDAAETADFPEMLTVSPSPHMKDTVTTPVIMRRVLIALAPAALWGVYSFGLRAAAILIISIVSCVFFEWAAQKILRRTVTVSDFSAAVTGLLIGMNLSASVPLWLPVAGSFFAIVVVKQLFGGIGKNIVNPALAARVFMFAWPSEMGVFTRAGERISSLAVKYAAPDAITCATPLASLKTGDLPSDSFFDMLLGNIGGCIGEVSSVLLIIGGIYLIMSKVITWHIPVSYIATVAVVCAVFPLNPDARLDFVLCELAAGGLMLGAVFMATDYTTSPVTGTGRVIFGIGCGLLTVFIRYFGGYPEGVSFSILIMNLLVWYIDKLTIPTRFGGKDRVKKEK